MTLKGERKNLSCQFAKVNKILASVELSCDNSHEVLLRGTSGDIISIAKGKRTASRRLGNIYGLDAWVPCPGCSPEPKNNDDKVPPIAPTAPISPKAHITIQLEPENVSSDDAEDEIQPIGQDGDVCGVNDGEPDAALDLDLEDNTDADAEPDDREDRPPPPPPAGPPRIRALKKPMAPTRLQRQLHDLCHLPYAAVSAQWHEDRAILMGR